MPRIVVKSPKDFPNRQMLDFRGSPDQAEKLHPGNTIYVFHQTTGGTIVMIDPAPPATDPDPIYQEEPTPAPADLQPDPEPIEPEAPPTKSLGSVLQNMTFNF